MDTSDVKRAIAAATSIATGLGLPADDAVVLHNSNKLALRLTPCDVFARVAPPDHVTAQFEVDLAQRLADVGSPVGRLEPRVEPVVYLGDGFSVTLWTYYEPATPEVSADEYATALGKLHDGMRKVEMSSPSFWDRITEAQEVVANPDRSPKLAAADRELLSGRLAEARRSIEEHGAAEQLLHGEPHAGNLLSTQNGPLFIDFETCCRGPVEFDLAHVSEEVCRHYPGIDWELLEHCRLAVLAMLAAWRWELGDQFPNGNRFGDEFLQVLRAGAPWPTADAVIRRVNGKEKLGR